MGVPCADDVMLNYQSTSFHDALAVRRAAWPETSARVCPVVGKQRLVYRASNNERRPNHSRAHATAVGHGPRSGRENQLMHDEMIRPPHAKSQDDDIERLHALGYRQLLARRLGGFSNFALSLSIICILAGGVTSFHLGLCSVGGASIGLGWPLVGLVALAVATTMGQLASTFPTAGGLYHWAAILGGRGWGWATAWFNLAGLITVLAAINVGTYRFALGALFPIALSSDFNFVTQVLGVDSNYCHASSNQPCWYRCHVEVDGLQRLLDPPCRSRVDGLLTGICSCPATLAPCDF